MPQTWKNQRERGKETGSEGVRGKLTHDLPRGHFTEIQHCFLLTNFDWNKAASHKMANYYNLLELIFAVLRLMNVFKYVVQWKRSSNKSFTFATTRCPNWKHTHDTGHWNEMFGSYELFSECLVKLKCWITWTNFQHKNAWPFCEHQTWGREELKSPKVLKVSEFQIKYYFST